MESVDLSQIISNNPDCLNDSKLLRAVLLDTCPNLNKGLLNVITTIAKSSIFNELRNLQYCEPSTEQRWIDILIDEYGFSKALVQSALSVWCSVFFQFVIKNGVLVEYRGQEDSVIIPEGVTRIHEGTFKTPNTIRSITIPNSLREIDGWAFVGCDSLKEVHISNLANWCAISFGTNEYDDDPEDKWDFVKTANPLSYAHNLYIKNQLVKRLIIPDDIIEIKQGVFFGWNGITMEVGKETESIGKYSFMDCFSLAKITLKEKIQYIDDTAFWNCNLYEIYDRSQYEGVDNIYAENIYIDEKDSCFEIDNNGFALYRDYSDGIIDVRLINYLGEEDEIVVPDSVTIIGEHAFNDSHIKSARLVSKVIHIHRNAFKNCKELTTIELPSNIEWFDSGAFEGCDNLETIIWNASNYTNTHLNTWKFASVSSLKKIIFSDKVTRISGWLCSECKMLECIEMHDSIERIDEYAFNNCQSIKSVSVPNSVNLIGAYAFSGCIKLENVLFGNKLTSIGEYAFSRCVSLQEIVLPGSLEQIGAYAFSACTNLKMVDMQDGIKTIGNFAFLKCNSLSMFDLPNSIKRISDGMFSMCYNLKKVCGGTNVQSIGHYAFYHCVALDDISMCKKAQSIADTAFEGCDSLR